MFHYAVSFCVVADLNAFSLFPFKVHHPNIVQHNAEEACLCETVICSVPAPQTPREHEYGTVLFLELYY